VLQGTGSPAGAMPAGSWRHETSRAEGEGGRMRHRQWEEVRGWSSFLPFASSTCACFFSVTARKCVVTMRPRESRFTLPSCFSCRSASPFSVVVERAGIIRPVVRAGVAQVRGGAVCRALLRTMPCPSIGTINCSEPGVGRQAMVVEAEVLRRASEKETRAVWHDSPGRRAQRAVGR